MTTYLLLVSLNEMFIGYFYWVAWKCCYKPEVGGEGGVAVICVMLVTSMIVGSTESGFLPARFFAFAWFFLFTAKWWLLFFFTVIRLLLFEESVVVIGRGDTEAEDQLKIFPARWWWNKAGPEGRVCKPTGSRCGFPPTDVAAIKAAVWLAASSDSAMGELYIWLLRIGDIPSAVPGWRPAEIAAAAAVTMAKFLLLHGGERLFMSRELGLLLRVLSLPSLLLPPRSTVEDEVVSFIPLPMSLCWWTTATGPPANQHGVNQIHVSWHPEALLKLLVRRMSLVCLRTLA